METGVEGGDRDGLWAEWSGKGPLRSKPECVAEVDNWVKTWGAVFQAEARAGARVLSWEGTGMFEERKGD